MDALRIVPLDPATERTLRTLVELDDVSFRAGLRYGEDGFRARLRPDVSVVLAAQVGESVVGVALCERRTDELFLDVLAVSPGWRGRGVGGRLVEAVVQRARTLGARAVTVHAERQDAGGLDLVRFYRKAGFVVDEDHGDWLAFSRPLRGRDGAARPPG